MTKITNKIPTALHVQSSTNCTLMTTCILVSIQYKELVARPIDKGLHTVWFCALFTPVQYIALRTVSRGTFNVTRYLYLRNTHNDIYVYVCTCVQLTLDPFKTYIISHSSNR